MMFIPTLNYKLPEVLYHLFLSWHHNLGQYCLFEGHAVKHSIDLSDVKVSNDSVI